MLQLPLHDFVQLVHRVQTVQEKVFVVKHDIESLLQMDDNFHAIERIQADRAQRSVSDIFLKLSGSIRNTVSTISAISP